MTAGGAEPAESPRPDGALYRAVWRWHFYAGLLCLPVLVLMAVTGGLYLFNKEIEGLVYRDLLQVPAAQVAALPPQTLLNAAQAAAVPLLAHDPIGALQAEGRQGRVNHRLRHARIQQGQRRGHLEGRAGREAAVDRLVQQGFALVVAQGAIDP
jgi:hypothetical protein